MTFFVFFCVSPRSPLPAPGDGSGRTGSPSKAAGEGLEDELHLAWVDPLARRPRFGAKPLELRLKPGGLLLERVALTLEPRTLLGQPVALFGERHELLLERTEALVRARRLGRRRRDHGPTRAKVGRPEAQGALNARAAPLACDA